MAKLKRKQIYLDEESEREIKQLAYTTKTSEAEIIREAVQSFLEMKRRDMEAKSDPLRDLIGLCDNPKGPKDASVHHDSYLYGRKK